MGVGATGKIIRERHRRIRRRSAPDQHLGDGRAQSGNYPGVGLAIKEGQGIPTHEIACKKPFRQAYSKTEENIASLSHLSFTVQVPVKPFSITKFRGQFRRLIDFKKYITPETKGVAVQIVDPLTLLSPLYAIVSTIRPVSVDVSAASLPASCFALAISSRCFSSRRSIISSISSLSVFGPLDLPSSELSITA